MRKCNFLILYEQSVSHTHSSSSNWLFSRAQTVSITFSYPLCLLHTHSHGTSLDGNAMRLELIMVYCMYMYSHTPHSVIFHVLCDCEKIVKNGICSTFFPSELACRTISNHGEKAFFVEMFVLKMNRNFLSHFHDTNPDAIRTVIRIGCWLLLRTLCTRKLKYCTAIRTQIQTVSVYRANTY